jgi:hypothetical protein
MKQKMMEEQRKKKVDPNLNVQDNMNEIKDDGDYEVTEEIKTEEMMYSDNESHSNSESDSSSSEDSQSHKKEEVIKPFSNNGEPQPDAAKQPKKMLNVNVGRSTIAMAEQFKSKDIE